jgi:ATP-binding cassette subfamily B protein
VAEQILIPSDHLLLEAADALPAIVVLRSALGNTHFVVVWRCHRGLVQVMDPSSGRVWSTRQALSDAVHIHEMAVSADAFRAWTATRDFLQPLEQRMRRLRLAPDLARRHCEAALFGASSNGSAELDAAVRFTQALVDAKALRRGREATRFLEEVLAQSRQGGDAIPAEHWFARPGPPTVDGEAQLIIRGAVLVRVKGVQRRQAEAAEPAIPCEIEAALHDEPIRPWRVLVGLVRASSRFGPCAIAAGLAVVASTVALEALLFRAIFDLDRLIGPIEHRLVAALALIIFLFAIAMLEVPLVSATLHFGRHLEVGLRLAFLQKLPKCNERYFRSRLTSDLAERSHVVHTVRELPTVVGAFTLTCFHLAAVVAGIAWLDAASAVPAVAAALAGTMLPLGVQPLLAEGDLRVRSHAGALSRFYLDALRGLVPVRVHRAERSLCREHEALLVEWACAAQRLLRWSLSTEALVRLSGVGFVVWLLWAYANRAYETSAALLLTYWALQLPALGYELAALARQYPGRKSVTLRLVETLGAPEPPRSHEETSASRGPCNRGAEIRYEEVSVRAGGHTVLEGITTAIVSGSHVAIVGSSGAGKSTLVGLLLGLHRPISGSVLIDGRVVEGEHLHELLRRTAWVDPEVQLWNRSLAENLRYGNPGASIGPAIMKADLRELLGQLSEGSRTVLGEGGALVSGGEGQRVRLGRALLREDPRLVILDEPFRGLERAQRRVLLERSLRAWKGATLLLVTHDMESVLDMQQVIVMHSGRIVEQGVPAVLARMEYSHFRAMLELDRIGRETLFADARWRRWRLDAGRPLEAPEVYTS